MDEEKSKNHEEEIDKNGKEKLPPLPEDSSNFWQHSEKITIVPEQVNKDCKHYFLLMKPNQAQCKFCSWGIYLEPEDRIEEGKLYRLDKLIL